MRQTSHVHVNGIDGYICMIFKEEMMLLFLAINGCIDSSGCILTLKALRFYSLSTLTLMCFFTSYLYLFCVLNLTCG